MAKLSRITEPIIEAMKKMHEAGAKSKYIARAFDVSTSTYQNVKKTGWNYTAYRGLISSQFKGWKDKSGMEPITTTTTKTRGRPRKVTTDMTMQTSNLSNGPLTRYNNIVVMLTELDSKVNDLIKRFNVIFPNL